MPLIYPYSIVLPLLNLCHPFFVIHKEDRRYMDSNIVINPVHGIILCIHKTSEQEWKVVRCCHLEIVPFELHRVPFRFETTLEATDKTATLLPLFLSLFLLSTHLVSTNIQPTILPLKHPRPIPLPGHITSNINITIPTPVRPMSLP